ncbi:MAG: ankyrin repeat domain-containing protein [Rickettsiales bacterium]
MKTLYTYFSLMVLALCLLFGTGAYAASNLNNDLVYKASLGQAKDIKLLLEKGADPNTKNEQDWPAISLAADRGDEESFGVVKALIEGGADIEAKNPLGETPLITAITVNNLKLVHYLLSQGANFYAVSQAGQGVKDYADSVGNPKIIKLIDDAIRMDRRLNEYIYYNCALSYLSYYRDSEQDAATLDEKEFNRKLEHVQKIIGEAYFELINNFKMDAYSLETIGKKSQMSIYNELEALISNRWRRQNGVGTDADLDKRCKNVLNNTQRRTRQ